MCVRGSISVHMYVYAGKNGDWSWRGTCLLTPDQIKECKLLCIAKKKYIFLKHFYDVTHHHCTRSRILYRFSLANTPTDVMVLTCGENVQGEILYSTNT